LEITAETLVADIAAVAAREVRRPIAEAARVARPGAGLFVFTFSRATLAADDRPVPGEPFVFTQFAGEPQCFLTEAELVDELLRGGPVIYEGTFRAVRPH
jgi:hypothetical protein